MGPPQQPSTNRKLPRSKTDSKGDSKDDPRRPIRRGYLKNSKDGSGAGSSGGGGGKGDGDRPPMQLKTAMSTSGSLADDQSLDLLCSALRLRLSRLRGFKPYFALLPLQSSNDSVAQISGLFRLGIPLCYIFDLLPEDEGFPKINLSHLSDAGNHSREEKQAIASFANQIRSDKVSHTIPDCEPLTVRDIVDSVSPSRLVKVMKTVNAILNYLPADVYEALPSPNLLPTESPAPEPLLYGLLPLPKASIPLSQEIQCQKADAAFNHLQMTELLISEALATSGLEGLYYIQVGFNEGLITRGQGVLEEIYIFIDSEIQSNQLSEVLPTLLTRLSQILSPFPGVLYTPENTYHIPPHPHIGGLSESEVLSILKMAGVFREGLDSVRTRAASGGAHAGFTANSGSVSGLHGKGSGANRKGKGREAPDQNDGKDSFEDNEQGGSGDGGDGGDPTGLSGPTRVNPGPKNLSIPFFSNLVLKGDKQEVLSRLTSSAIVNVKLTETTLLDGKSEGSPTDPSSCPNGWFGPWFGIHLPFIKTNSSDALPDDLHYCMSVAQVRVIASSCLSSFISFSPEDSYNVEDPIKTKSERNYTGGGWATFSATPSVKVGGSTSQTSGQETSQKKWQIVVSPSSGSEDEKSITWKYALNEEHYDAQPTATFKPGPSVDFGYALFARRPVLHIELVVLWSSSPDNTRPHWLRQWFSRHRSKEDPRPHSAFTNLLHQVSVSVDLENLHTNAWVVGLNPKLPDEETLPDFHGLQIFEPIKVNADNGKNDLNCEVTLQRALHGRIQLNKRDRTSDQPLLPSLLGSSSAVQQTLSAPILPTPPRSPPRSPKRSL